jgi:hypothetical protein
MLKRRIS